MCDCSPGEGIDAEGELECNSDDVEVVAAEVQSSLCEAIRAVFDYADL